MLLFSHIPIREFWGKMKKPSILEEGFGKKATVQTWAKTMKNQCQHTGQNAAFKLLFSRIPIREFWGKMKKPSILEEGFGKTIDFGRRIWKKSNCPNLGKNHEKSMSTHWAKRCFQVVFFTYPHT